MLFGMGGCFVEDYIFCWCKGGEVDYVFFEEVDYMDVFLK